MYDTERVADLRGLHQDLVALSISQFTQVDRLCQELQTHIDAFRQLLDKKAKNAESRKALSSGKIEAAGIEYNVNAEFQEQAIHLADAIDLDELDAAALLLEGQNKAEILDRTPLACAVICFHEYRSFLLSCVQLVFELSFNVDIPEPLRDILRDATRLVLANKAGSGSDGSMYMQRCIKEMAQIEHKLQALAERAQRAVTLMEASDANFIEILGLQQESLTQEHEALGMILAYLVKGGHTRAKDFLSLVDHMPTVDKWNNYAIHYVPALVFFSSHYGSSENNSSYQEARSINNKILESRDLKPWPLRHLQAAFTTWWLAEYSGWHFEQAPGSPIPGIDFEAEAKVCADAFSLALQNGALQCTLSICSALKSRDWSDPARLSLTKSLLDDAPVLPPDRYSISPGYQKLVMESFETFTDAFIANMPDTLRRFKMQEDGQRRKLLAGLPNNGHNGASDHDRYLELFLITVSYAYEGRPEAAEAFWADTESNMYGFLQWASRRQSTPCVGAFCEMFRAISEGEEHAMAAHRFLLEEGVATSSRLRRSVSLSWSQLFDELSFYAAKTRDHPLPSIATSGKKPDASENDEPESPMMLECYLRLIAHLCAQSEAIRAWVTGHPTFNMISTLFDLCQSTLPVQIRACAYPCLEALLTQKRGEIGDRIWTELDQWVSFGFVSRPALKANSPTWSKGATFETIATSFEEASSFTRLLGALVSPAIDMSDLRDALPFPEGLGASYRMPGIEAYVDFVFGKVFSRLLPRLEGTLQFQILACDVLRFAKTCLTTFNEDLLILANKSVIDVDSCVDTSSLAAYARLHPFSRVVEWMFNEGAVKVLFTIAHHNISEVGSATVDSPLLSSLLGSIETMICVMDLQSTYLDIVRPLIKTQRVGRREPVLSPAIASFEDSVLNHLRVIVDLLYYCGSGHAQLTLASIKLLQKFTSSRKLNAAQLGRFGFKADTNRLVNVLQHNSDTEPIARSLTHALEFDPREVDSGLDSPRFQIKAAILDFLEQTLGAVPTKPNIAHALLGFDCVGNSLLIPVDSMFSRGESLFHAIVGLALNYPDHSESTMLSWLLGLKQKALNIIDLLWKSTLSSLHVLSDLRENGYFFSRWTAQNVIEQTTPWDHAIVREPTFVYKGHCMEALKTYLDQRRSLLEYAVTELRLAKSQDLSLLRSRMISTIVGSTSTDNGDQSNSTVFDLLDFIEIEPQEHNPVLRLNYCAGIDISTCTLSGSPGQPASLDEGLIRQLLFLKQKELRKNGKLQDTAAEDKFEEEFSSLMINAVCSNRQSSLHHARQQTLKAWADLVTLFVENAEVDASVKTAFTLQTFQIICPKLESFVVAERPEALTLARLAQVLLAQLDLTPSMVQNGGPGDVMADRLFQFFRVALRAISDPSADAPLRQVLYKICYRYLIASSGPSKQRPYSIQTIKAMGVRLIDVICDDGYSGEGPNRVAAMLVLDALARLAEAENSKYLIESLARTSFIVVLVESIKDIQEELRQGGANDAPLLLETYKAKFSLLLTLSQSRPGAVHVVNAGLFTAVRKSGLFAIDPDLGLEYNNTEALCYYYELLCALLRIVAAVALSRGQQNAHTMEQVRSFLIENRLSMVGIFKRQAKVTILDSKEMDPNSQAAVDELADIYVLLVSLAGFIEHEEQQDTQISQHGFFS